MTHRCSHSLQCKSNDCHHAVDHAPRNCDTNAPCGSWPNNPGFQPSVCCIPKDHVMPIGDCKDCGGKEKEGHHFSDCIGNLKAKIARLEKERDL